MICLLRPKWATPWMAYQLFCSNVHNIITITNYWLVLVMPLPLLVQVMACIGCAMMSFNLFVPVYTIWAFNTLIWSALDVHLFIIPRCLCTTHELIRRYGDSITYSITVTASTKYNRHKIYYYYYSHHPFRNCLHQGIHWNRLTLNLQIPLYSKMIKTITFKQVNNV